MKDSQIIDNDILLNMIDNHINEGISSSFIRKGDGENIVIGYKNIDEILNLNKINFKVTIITIDGTMTQRKFNGFLRLGSGLEHRWSETPRSGRIYGNSS